MKIAILPLSFWRLNLISCERVATGPFANRNFNSVFGDRTSFRAKELAGRFTNCNFTTVFGDQASFRAKGLRRTLCTNRNFAAVFRDRTSFRAKGLRSDKCK